MDNKYNYFINSNKVYMIIIAVLILMLILYGHINIGITATFLYVFLIIYNIKNTRSRKNRWKEFIEDFHLNLM